MRSLGGRPRTTMTEDVIADVLRLVRSGICPTQAARACGIAASTLRSHHQRHPSFAEAVRRAEAVAEASAFGVVQVAASGGDARAAAFLRDRGWAKLCKRNLAKARKEWLERQRTAHNVRLGNRALRSLRTISQETGPDVSMSRARRLLRGIRTGRQVLAMSRSERVPVLAILNALQEWIESRQAPAASN